MTIAIQQPLAMTTTGSKALINVPVSTLTISPLNPRRTRPESDIKRLAERMARNGYELTRAMWVYAEGNGYAVFAGGTRLQAARAAGLSEVPVILHKGFGEEELILLAEQDNENDEYHSPVPIADAWLSYKALAEQGWTQERIARAKGCVQSLVSVRIRLAELPEVILTSITKNGLSERHAREILEISPGDNLKPWLPRETAMLEVIDEALKKKAPTATVFAEIVKGYNALYQLAEDLWQSLPEDRRGQFVERLAKKKARTPYVIRQVHDAIALEVAEEKRRAEEEALLAAKQAEEERIAAERAERLIHQREEWMARNARLLQGDMVEMCQSIEPGSIDVIITDPPYAQEYLPLYGALATEATRLLKPGGSLLVMCGQSYLPEIFSQMTPHIRYHWTVSYLTPGGQAVQLWQRKVNTFWKPVLWFVNGEYDGDWIGDVAKSAVNDNDKRYHDWGQSESGMADLVERFSSPGNVILDPFVGGGTTAVVALRLERRFVGIDEDAQAIETTRGRIAEVFECQMLDQSERVGATLP